MQMIPLIKEGMNEMNNKLSIFNNEVFGNISVIMDSEQELWWFADEVCAILGLDDHRQSTRYLDEDEKRLFTKHTNAGPRNVTIINESGLWSLVLRSRRPEAKPFKKWLTKEVIPTIRKTGTYSLNQGPTPSYMIENPGERAERWAEEYREKEKIQQQALALQYKIQEDEPLTEIGRSFIEREQDSYSVKQVAQSFSKYMLDDEHRTIGLNTFMAFLRFAKIVGQNNLPYQKYIDRGLLKVNDSLINGRIYQSTHFMNKGIEWFFFKNKSTLVNEWQNYVKLINRRKKLVSEVIKELKNNP